MERDAQYYRDQALALGRSEPEQAVKLYSESISRETNPEQKALDHFAKGVLLSQELGRHEESLEEFKTAAELHAGWDMPYYQIYSVCNELGLYEEAQQNLAKCIFLFKGTDVELDHLRKNLKEVGDKVSGSGNQ